MLYRAAVPVGARIARPHTTQNLFLAYLQSKKHKSLPVYLFSSAIASPGFFSVCQKKRETSRRSCYNLLVFKEPSLYTPFFQEETMFDSSKLDAYLTGLCQARDLPGVSAAIMGPDGLEYAFNYGFRDGASPARWTTTPCSASPR